VSLVSAGLIYEPLYNPEFLIALGLFLSKQKLTGFGDRVTSLISKLALALQLDL